MTQTSVAQPLTKGQLWQRGFTAYLDNVRFEALGCESERQGWKSAQKAEAQFTMPAPLNSVDTDEYEDDILDREDWSRGAW